METLKKEIIVGIKNLMEHENIAGSIAVYELNELDIQIPTKDKLDHFVEVLATDGVECSCTRKNDKEFEHSYDLQYEDLDIQILQIIHNALTDFLA